MAAALPGWKFVASHRHFRRAVPCGNHLIHISFINHPSDFDATIDVAVEFRSGGKSACLIGAELGNIAGVGQKRFGVTDETSADQAAQTAIANVMAIGLPFLARYSDPDRVVAVLRAADSEANLISPIEALNPGKIAVLERIRDGV